jgi:hypothetical protein
VGLVLYKLLLLLFLLRCVFCISIVHVLVLIVGNVRPLLDGVLEERGRVELSLTVFLQFNSMGVGSMILWYSEKKKR